MAEMLASAGDVVICPDCQEPLYRFRRDVEMGEMTHHEQVAPASPKVKQPEWGDPFEVCPECGAQWWAGDCAPVILAFGVRE